MGTPKHSGKPHLRGAHVDSSPMEITKDDHRNNPDFLKKHPHVTVKSHNAAKKIKPPHKHHPVNKHHPDTHTKIKQSKLSIALHKKKKPGENKNVSMHDEDAQLLEDQNLQLDSDELNEYDDINHDGGQYLHHEIASEEHDPLSDLDNADALSVTENRYGYQQNQNRSQSTVSLPTDLTIDPKSFVPVFDAKDGTVSFKASLIFNQDDSLDVDVLENFDIIITQVVPQ